MLESVVADSKPEHQSGDLAAELHSGGGAHKTCGSHLTEETALAVKLLPQQQADMMPLPDMADLAAEPFNHASRLLPL